MKKYIIAIDQGTTSSRVLVLDKSGTIIHREQMEVNIYDEDGAIIQNAEELLETVKLLLEHTFRRYELLPDEVAAIGITNQRETSIIWDKKTGRPIYKAISWQSKHTEPIIDEWKKLGIASSISEKTGLEMNAYFSASKIRYILDQYNGNIDDLLFGTVDSYLLYHLSVEKAHKTDVTNASRTMLFNIRSLDWDDELLSAFHIPRHILPEVVPNDHCFGHYEYDGVRIPIHAMIGDQQAALFGNMCFHEGDLKVTYGTGGFILLNTGKNLLRSNSGLLSTVAWHVGNTVNYALEGSVFICGAAVQWLRDELKIIKTAAETEELAYAATDNSIYFVPSFVGLGTPYWNSAVRATILGLKRKSNRNDIVKATLESIGFQIEDILQVLKKDSHLDISEITADGGASQNKFLMQFQADISDIRVLENEEVELTALGAAYIAGLAVGFWANTAELEKSRKIKKVFSPVISATERQQRYRKWCKAVQAAIMFSD